MRTERELRTENVEGAPTLTYEVWYHMHPDGLGWVFIGYRVLSLRQVLKYQSFGYHVERSLDRDRRDLVPLFPRLDATPADWGEGLDPVPMPEPGPPGSEPVGGNLT